ncbi:MAG: MGH1-like glycoside hydrolase domain-containing protein [Acidimicrobiales bacterium]
MTSTRPARTPAPVADIVTLRPTGSGAPDALRRRAIGVLEKNARPGYVAPALGIYVHQHLWDTCFTAIGQRHYDLEGAVGSLRRLVGAQWKNGMVPHIRYEKSWRYWWDRQVWRSWVSPAAPRRVATGGITQPPMIAEAVVRVGELLPPSDRQAWYRRMYPSLLAYHEWLHFDRALDGSGLVFQIHPWETGLDNSPPLIDVLDRAPSPWWLDVVARTGADRLATRLRWDTRYVPADERSSTLEALRLYAALAHIRRLRYDSRAAFDEGPFVIEDLTFNCILVRANARLREIAAEIDQPLPARLADASSAHEGALCALWDADDECYHSRDPRTAELIREPSIASLMPLYAGCADPARASRMVATLADPTAFGSPYPVPSVPMGSRCFDPRRYWQGPTWVNTNWLLIDGLRRYGYHPEADSLRLSTLAVVEKSGFREYYHPRTGDPAGANDFSWTAALVVDLLTEARLSDGAGAPVTGPPPAD